MGAQYRYDARNVEALAAQVALQTWRTLLLGQKFEIYSDHDSLQYLFTPKSPSQRTLRLCEFLSDFNFEEIKYVPGAHNVVPDFPLARGMGRVTRCPQPSMYWLPVHPVVYVRQSTHASTISRGIAIVAGFCGCSNKAPTHRSVVCDNWSQRNLTRRS